MSDQLPSRFLLDSGSISGPAPKFLANLRKSSAAHFLKVGMPGPRNEDWRFTNLAPLAELSFRPSHDVAITNISLEKIQELAFRDTGCIRLVFVNGLYSEELSDIGELPTGVSVLNIAVAIQNQPDLIENQLGRIAATDEFPFTALNTASFRDGAAITIGKNVALNQPIHLVFLATTPGESIVAHPRNLITMGENSRATIIESFIGFGESPCFTNCVGEVSLARGAVLDHYKLQREDLNSFHIGMVQVVQQRDSNFSTHFIGMGGRLVRNEVRVRFDDEHCEATVNGVYMASGRQHMDNHTVIDHAKAHCNSHELYKGILDDRAHGVFNGKILVREDAQKTDAKQTNQTLLLSEDAVIDTKPQLEIFADDVRCTHGATIGQLEDEALFYLRTRGIGMEQARSLLTYAFANDVIRKIKPAQLRYELEEALLKERHLPFDHDIQETL